MYLFKSSARANGEGKGGSEAARVQLLGSGAILREVIAAAELLARDWGVAADVWSVTSFTELRRDGMACARTRRLGGEAQSWVERCLAPTRGPVIAASDYVSAVADLIRAYVPRRYVALGTDGFGRSDTRERLREFFEVSARHVALAALAALAEEGKFKRAQLTEAAARYGVDRARAAPWTR